MGMLATVINSLALQSALEEMRYTYSCSIGSIEMHERLLNLLFSGKAVRHLEKGRIVIFAGGTGNPYFYN
jgi:uridylate kinase